MPGWLSSWLPRVMEVEAMENKILNCDLLLTKTVVLVLVCSALFLKTMHCTTTKKKTKKKQFQMFLLYKVHRLILAIVLPLTTRSKQKQQIPHTKKGNSTHNILFLNSFKSMFIFLLHSRQCISK